MRGATLATRRAIAAALVTRVSAQAFDNGLGRYCRDCGPQKGLDGTPPGHSAGENPRDGIKSLIVHDDPLLGTSGAIARYFLASAPSRNAVYSLLAYA